MRTANTIGADKYFHCKANCEASKRGKLGLKTAEIISDFREYVDQNIKGDSIESSIEDQKANTFGREYGVLNLNQSCKGICGEFRPNGLSEEY